MFAIVYFVFPLDFDFLPIVGKLDDLLIALFLISAPGVWLFVKLCPQPIVLEHVKQLANER